MKNTELVQYAEENHDENKNGPFEKKQELVYKENNNKKSSKILQVAHVEPKRTIKPQKTV